MGSIDVWWRVLFVFLLGNSFIAIGMILLWYVGGIDYYSEWGEAVSHSWLFVIVGC